MLVTGSVLSIVLLAAALHATWNAIVKGGGDKLMTMVLIVGAAAVIAAATLPFLPSPARASWPFLAASAAVHVGYYLMVAVTYRAADMSEAYPVMRGTAPLLVAFASAAFLGEKLAPLAWLGVAMISGGILGMALGRRARGRGTLLALLNAAIIATYTLIDGSGVRRSGVPVGYTLWMFLLTGAPLVAWALGARRSAFLRSLSANWLAGVAGGFGTVVSYALVLWAMTVAPVTIVAALRETAIVFATAISGVVLKERIGPARVVGACVIAAGVAALRLA